MCSAIACQLRGMCPGILISNTLRTSDNMPMHLWSIGLLQIWILRKQLFQLVQGELIPWTATNDLKVWLLLPHCGFCCANSAESSPISLHANPKDGFLGMSQKPSD